MTDIISQNELKLEHVRLRLSDPFVWNLGIPVQVLSVSDRPFRDVKPNASPVRSESHLSKDRTTRRPDPLGHTQSGLPPVRD
jgi:hypothetical protein